MNLYARTLYRPVSRLMHRVNLHHTQRSGPLEPDGTYLHHCNWCGVSRTETPMHVTARRIADARTGLGRAGDPVSDADDRATTTERDARAHQARNWDRWDNYDPRDDRPSPSDLAGEDE